MPENIISFSKKKKESIEKKRRSFERIIFHNLLGAYSTLFDNEDIYPIDIIDISKEGCLFQLPYNQNIEKKLLKGNNIDIRMYFTESSYIPITLIVKHIRKHIKENDNYYVDYGCEFDKSLGSFKAIKDFVNFMSSFAEYSLVDTTSQKNYFF